MFTTPAYAQSAGGSDVGGILGMANGILPIILIFVIMYFLILRPQQQKAKQHRELVANIRRGDTIVTSGGLIGKVAKVDEREIHVEVAEGVKVRLVRGMVAEVREKGEPVKEGA